MYKNIFFVFAALLLSISVSAIDDNQDLIKKAGTTKDYPGSSVVVVYDSMKVDVQSTGLSYVNMHTLTKILTPQGAMNNSVVKFGYDPLSAFVELKKVRVYRTNGNIDEIDIKKVQDYPAPAGTILWGAREIMLEVGRLETGDAVEVFAFRKGFTYALLADNEDDRYIPPMKGHFYDIIEFWSANPVKLKVYRVTLPKDKNLRFEFYNGEAKVVSSFDDKNMTYTFSKSDMQPFHGEPNMVAYSDVAPKLLLSTSPDWHSKSRWFYKVNEDYQSFAATPEIKAKVNELLKPAKNRMDSISILTHWVADEIRYFGLCMGPGEGYTLHKGEMTYSDRCGVCKDKAGILITMLRAAGFKSYAAMTMAGSRIDYIPADQFNHSVTVVQFENGEYLLLDPTWVPFVRELWSSREQQQNYLIGSPNGEDLMITPISPPENHWLKIHGVSELMPDGTLKGEFRLTAEGQADAAFRAGFTRSFKANWEYNLKNELLADFPGMQITELTYPDGYDYSQPFRLIVKYTIPNYATVTDKEFIFTPVISSNLFKSKNPHLSVYTGLDKRKFQFRDHCTRYVELKEVVKLPPNLKVVYMPDPQSVDGSGASYTGAYAFNGENIEMNQRITLKKRIYNPEDWESFKRTVLNQKKFADEKIILSK
jgi:hypothetical protein